MYHCQRRIQDFLEGAPTLQGVGRQHTILQHFPKKKNCMKLGNFGPGAPRVPPLDPQMIVKKITFESFKLYPG